MLHVVGNSEPASAKNMIQLYKSLVLPHLEYAASVWQIGNCEQLNKVQRKCLGDTNNNWSRSTRGCGRGSTTDSKTRGPGSQKDYKDHGKRQCAENSRMFSDLES